jgi:murein DD-endopeptidase MepM/ murein hydrolase activator NlpD
VQLRAIVVTSALVLVFTSGAVFARTLTVQPGDSLWSIARTHGTTIDALIAANNLTSDNLRIGQRLTLPDGEATAPAPSQSAASPSPAATANTPTSAPVAPRTHTVKAGDSLYNIARANGVTVDSLIAWNNIDGTLIRPGQILTLDPSSAAPAAPLVVHVQPGDSLWALARTYGTTVEALARTNSIAATSTLRVGQALTIPGRYGAVNATTGGSNPDVGGTVPIEVRVVAGDNLWKIARQHNTTTAAIAALNGLDNDLLRVGQVLRVVPGPDIGLASVPQLFIPEGGDSMVWPLVGQITSRFGWRRLSVGGSNMHSGLDIDGNTGDPIRSATSGTVTFAGWKAGLGYTLVVEKGTTEYWYAHASSLLAKVGQRVNPGDVIARVGATGVATGAHLHFEIRVDGRPIDPLPILEARAKR